MKKPEKSSSNAVASPDIEFAGSDAEGAKGRATRIREIADELGSLNQLARRSGVPLSNLQRVASGQELRADALVKISRAASVRLEWLALGTGPKHNSEVGAFEVGATELASEPDESLSVHTPFPTLAATVSGGVVTVPQYDARAAAGRNGGLDEGRVVEQVRFSEEWVRVKLRRNPRNLALLEARGDSMEPTIGDGDVLMIDIAPGDLRSGRAYVVEIGGELLVKRIQRRLNGSLLVISDNNRYPPEELHSAEAEQLRVIGEVVWHGGVF